MTKLQRYIRHVELYGPEGVLQAARMDGLSPTDLGHLILRMRRVDKQRYERDVAAGIRAVDPAWRLTQAERQRLAQELIEDGASDKFLRDVLDVGQAAIRGFKAA